MIGRIRSIPGGSSFGVKRRVGGRRPVTLLTAIWVVAGVSLVGFVTTDNSGDDLVTTFFEASRGDMIFIETPSGAR